MRWFTPEAYAADDDTILARAVADHAAHLATIAPELPKSLVLLATDPRHHLHDGRFQEVVVNATAQRIAMSIDCGDLQVGYRRLHLQFGGATFAPDDLQRHAAAIGAEFRPNQWNRRRSVTEIRDVEVDRLDDGRFVLRLGLWPFHELAIEFNELAVVEEPLLDRGPTRAGTLVVDR
jgi:hypothetical protein